MTFGRGDLDDWSIHQIERGTFMRYHQVSFVLSACAFSAGFLRYVTGSIYWAVLYVMCGIVAGLILVMARRRSSLDILVSFAVLLALSILAVSSLGDQGLRPFFFLVIMLSAFLLAWIMVEARIVWAVSLFALAVVSAVVMYQFLRHGFNPAAYNQVFEHASRNRLGAFLLIAAIATTAGYYRERGVVVVMPALLATLLALPLYGRSTIAGAAALLGLVLFVRYRRIRWPFVLGLVPVLFVASGFIGMIWDWLSVATNFSRSLESPRWDMFSQYIITMDVSGVLFGSPLAEVPLIHAYDGNPHNSFIRLHSMYGALPLVVLLLILLLFGMVSGPFLFCMIGIVVFRISLDTVAFGDYLDHLIFAILFLGLRGHAAVRR